MDAGGNMKSGERYVRQLDILRGFAILLMVVNHCGFALLTPQLQRDPVIACFIFVGGLAPVLFFFTTGFGIGIARTGVSFRDFRSTLLKALLLAVADQFFFWSHKTAYGLDFLGFIALSTVFVTAIAANRRPVRLSLVFIVLDLLLRYALGPFVRPRLPATRVGDWIIGIGGLENVSYSLSPWIIYPLLGFVMAHLYKSGGGSMTKWFGRWPAVTGTTAIGMAISMAFTNAAFYRWGTVSLAYFVLSIGAIYVSMILIWRFDAWSPRTASLICLRGIASLAVVPIHYALIEASAALQMDLQRSGAAIVLTGLIVASISLATGYAALIRFLISNVPGVAARGTLVALVVLNAVLIWRAAPPSSGVFICVAVGQLAIAGLLAARTPRSATATTRAVPMPAADR